MRLIRRVVSFVIVFILITQYTTCFFVPFELVYKYRIKYRVFKNNPNTIEAIMDKIKQRIDQEKIVDYAIILGDSVGFSTPVAEEDSLAPLLESHAHAEGYKTVFFNLALPSEYPGDIYTIIKMLQQHGISTDHLIVNFNYFEFVFDQQATSMFWLKQQLRDMDLKAYNHIYGQMEKHYGFKRFKDRASYLLGTDLNILLYKDFFRAGLSSLLVRNYHDMKEDTRPWYEKKNLYESLKKSDKNWYFKDSRIVLDETRSCIYFINKIVDQQKGKHTLIFLPGYNRELLKEELSKEGYNHNLQNIDNYFKSTPVNYINLDRKIDYKQYADFIHLTPEGYKLLAQELWTNFKGGLVHKK